MILDVENLYSDDQALTTTADSTNVIDLGAAERGPGNPLRIDILVTLALTGGTDVTIDLETDDNASFTSLSTIGSTQTIAAATLVAGYRFSIQFVPSAMERYSRLEYTITGTFSAGTVTAGIVFDVQSAKSTFPSATI
tara:strand:- start:847 stop:1260 length:414 start_codon:yes stop_codon:yes gene_type:complete